MKNARKTNIIYSLLLGLLGIALIVFQTTAKHVVYAVIGIGLIAAALIGLIGWFQLGDRRNASHISQLLGSIVLGLMGLWILTHASGFDKLINWIIGIVLIVTGVQWLIRNRGPFRSKAVSVLAVISILIGVIVAIYQMGTSLPVIAQGISLIYSAAMGLIGERLLRQN